MNAVQENYLREEKPELLGYLRRQLRNPGTGTGSTHGSDRDEAALHGHGQVQTDGGEELRRC